MSEVLKQKIRRDLSRWSRKLLVCIGLETIGRQLVGEESWETLYPVQDWAQDRTTVSDFDPTQDFATQDPSHIELDPSASPDDEPGEEKNDFLEKFYHLLPYWYFINRAFGIPGGGAGPVSEDLSNNTHHPLLEAFDAQRLNSFLLLHSLKQQQLQVQAGSAQTQEIPYNSHVQNLSFLPVDPHELANDYSSSRVPSEPDFTQRHSTPFRFPGLSASHPPQEDDLDQPLDLTQKHKNLDNSNDRSPLLFGAEEVKSNGRDFRISQSPQKSNSKPTQRAGRGYTSLELEAALRDIQSGKLGTRRAAVIYGIPRSTLRNKVYKLGKDRGRTYNGTRSGTKTLSESPVDNLTTLDQDGGRHGTYLSGNGREMGMSFRSSSAVPSSLSRVGLEEEPLDEDETEEEEVKLEEISEEKKFLKEWLRTKLSRQNMATAQVSSQEFIGNSTGRRVPTSLGNVTDCSDEDPSDADESKESRQDVILKIPSFLKNKSSGNRAAAFRRKITLRSHKNEFSAPEFRQSHSASTPTSTITSPMEMDASWSGSRAQESDENSETEIRNGSDARATHHIQLEEDKDTSDQTSLTLPPYMLDEKKSRPKRGKYRNYDRDALLKAVKAVQNGEMSVHRAGSYFGVPHSTLEYKVKERHLLRRPKKKGTGSPKSSQKSSPESSLSGSEPLHSVSVSAPETMSLTPSARESLSRLLNMGTFHSPSSETNVQIGCLGKGASTESKGSAESYRTTAASAGSQYMNLFHMEDLIRHNLDTSNLLDLTKKS